MRMSDGIVYSKIASSLLMNLALLSVRQKRGYQFGGIKGLDSMKQVLFQRLHPGFKHFLFGWVLNAWMNFNNGKIGTFDSITYCVIIINHIITFIYNVYIVQIRFYCKRITEYDIVLILLLRISKMKRYEGYCFYSQGDTEHFT